MNEVNKFGLKRYIPGDIKLRIRQKCGFGCVICGMTVCQYEHIEPEFNEAKEHNPENMALLCGACHDKITRGFWSKDKVKDALKKPKCLQKGFTRDFFDIGNNAPTIYFADSIFKNMEIIVRTMGVNILEVAPPEELGAPFRISGIFCNNSGDEIFKIVNNEFIGDIKNYDIDIIGKCLTIKKDNKKIALKLIVEPPNIIIIIEEIDMYYNESGIWGNIEDGFCIKRPAFSDYDIRLYNIDADSAYCGVLITEYGVDIGIQSPKDLYEVENEID